MTLYYQQVHTHISIKLAFHYLCICRRVIYVYIGMYICKKCSLGLGLYVNLQCNKINYYFKYIKYILIFKFHLL